MLGTVFKCCAWRAYFGLNAEDWTLQKFVSELSVVYDQPQAILFNGAYGSNVDVAANGMGNEGCTNKKEIVKRCEQIKDWITSEDMGDVYELPIIYNAPYGRIIPFVWYVKVPKLLELRRQSVKEWSNSAIRSLL